jgi:hypothetical protein
VSNTAVHSNAFGKLFDMIVVTFYSFWGFLAPLFLSTLFSQIITPSHLQAPCHPLRYPAEEFNYFAENGEVILNLQSGRVQTNKLTPQILQTFEDANTQIDKILAKSQTQQIDLQG